jgi:hypothetical protein
MKKYVMLVVLLAAGAVGATPMPSREKPNALGFHQHQPKSSLRNFAPAPVVADTTSATDETSMETPPPGPGRIAPTDKTGTEPLGPGRITPTDKTRTEPPEHCVTQRMGGPAVAPWGCAVTKGPKPLPEPGTYALLAVGLMAWWWSRFANRFRSRRPRSIGAAVA